MKIVDVVCSAGRTGFYFDDQRAIKGGADHDGFTYVGSPVTPGFSAVRQAGESISVMIILEDGQVAYGACAAVQYSGAGLSSLAARLTASKAFPKWWKPSPWMASACILLSVMA